MPWRCIHLLFHPASFFVFSVTLSVHPLLIPFNCSPIQYPLPFYLSSYCTHRYHACQMNAASPFFFNPHLSIFIKLSLCLLPTWLPLFLFLLNNPLFHTIHLSTLSSFVFLLVATPLGQQNILLVFSFQCCCTGHPLHMMMISPSFTFCHPSILN